MTANNSTDTGRLPRLAVHVIRPRDLSNADLRLLRSVGYLPPLARRLSKPRLELLPR